MKTPIGTWWVGPWGKRNVGFTWPGVGLWTEVWSKVFSSCPSISVQLLPQKTIQMVWPEEQVTGAVTLWAIINFPVILLTQDKLCNLIVFQFPHVQSDTCWPNHLCVDRFLLRTFVWEGLWAQKSRIQGVCWWRAWSLSQLSWIQIQVSAQELMSSHLWKLLNCPVPQFFHLWNRNHMNYIIGLFWRLNKSRLIKM